MSKCYGVCNCYAKYLHFRSVYAPQSVGRQQDYTARHITQFPFNSRAKGKRNANCEIGKYNTRATCRRSMCHIFSARDYYSRFRDSLLKTSICSTLCAISLCARVSVPRAISEQAQGVACAKDERSSFEAILDDVAAAAHTKLGQSSNGIQLGDEGGGTSKINSSRKNCLSFWMNERTKPKPKPN